MGRSARIRSRRRRRNERLLRWLDQKLSAQPEVSTNKPLFNIEPKSRPMRLKFIGEMFQDGG